MSQYCREGAEKCRKHTENTRRIKNGKKIGGGVEMLVKIAYNVQCLLRIARQHRLFENRFHKTILLIEEEKTMFNRMKRVLATTLAVAVVTVPCMGVYAATETNTSSNSSSTATTTETPAAEIPTTSSAGGVKSTTPGVYIAKSVNGSAVATPAATISAAFGLANNEKPCTKVSDFNPKKSTAAASVLNAVAATQKATVGPMLNIEFGKTTAGKYSLLPKTGAIEMRLALPGNFFKAGATYAVIRVSEGGLYEIIPATADEKGNLAFITNGGQGAYAIIRY